MKTKIAVLLAAVALTGLAVPEASAATRDRDNDGIPNRIDRDRDGDGIQNKFERNRNVSRHSGRRVVVGNNYYGGGYGGYHGGYGGYYPYRSGSSFSIGIGLGSPYYGGGYGYPYSGYGYGSYPYSYGSGYGYGYSPYASYRRPVYSSGYRGGGSVVAQVQLRLARAGYYRGAIDGVMGPGTRNAIFRYERRNGLYADGRIDRVLLRSMGLS